MFKENLKHFFNYENVIIAKGKREKFFYINEGCDKNVIYILEFFTMGVYIGPILLIIGLLISFVFHGWI